MGNGGKVVEQQRARELRARSWTLAEIAAELGVSKSSASLWTRGVNFEPRPRNRGHSSHKPHPLTVKKQAELERCRVEARDIAKSLSDRDFFIYGLTLYLGEGAKTEASGFRMANTSTAIMRSFVRWLRMFFDIDETRLRGRLYLHDDLDEHAAITHWSEALDVPLDQFQRSYRPVRRSDFKTSKHEFGCMSIGYGDVSIFRRVMAMNDAISCTFADPG